MATVTWEWCGAEFGWLWFCPTCPGGSKGHRASVSHCPRCGSTRPDLLSGMSGEDHASNAVLAERAKWMAAINHWTERLVAIRDNNPPSSDVGSECNAYGAIAALTILKTLRDTCGTGK